MKQDILDLVATGKMTGRTTPLALPRMTRQEAQARSALAQRVHGNSVNWGEREWRLRLIPLADAAIVADGGEWLVEMEWGGAPLEIFVPGAAAQAWVEACYPELAIPSLPDAFVTPLLEGSIAQVVASLAALQKGPVRVDAIARGGRVASTLGHAFFFEASHGARSIHGRLATSSLGLMLAAGLVAKLLPVPNRLATDDLPIRLRAEIGRTKLGPEELARLRPGDAVLLEHALLTSGGELWLGAGDMGLRVHVDDSHLTVVEALTQGGHAMVDESDAAATVPEPKGLDHLPMLVSFDLGQRTLTLGEVRTLQPGQVLALDQPLTSAVNIRVNGALVGVGELVEIDGRLGVVIGSLFESASPQPALEDLQAEEAAE